MAQSSASQPFFWHIIPTSTQDKNIFRTIWWNSLCMESVYSLLLLIIIITVLYCICNWPSTKGPSACILTIFGTLNLFKVKGYYYFIFSYQTFDLCYKWEFWMFSLRCIPSVFLVLRNHFIQLK